MSFLKRLLNLWKGFLGLFVKKLEVKNPEAVYENAINELTEKYNALKEATAAIVQRREELSQQLTTTQSKLLELNSMIDVAVSEGKDELALELIQEKNDLQQKLKQIDEEFQQVRKDAEKLKQNLLLIKEKVHKLKTERDQTIARLRTAEAKKKAHAVLDDFSLDEEHRVLNEIREYVERVNASITLDEELGQSKLDSLKEDLERERAEKELAERRKRLQSATGNKTL